MFRILRAHMKKVFWVLVFLIIPAFVFWGVGGMFNDESRKPVGRAFGKNVTLSSYLKTRNACMLNAIIVYGKRYNDLAQYFDFNKQTWDRIVLQEEVKKLGITISNDELALQLQKLFSVNGEFSNARYQQFIKSTGVNPLTLEKNVRSTMAIGRLTRTIADTAMVTKEEVNEALGRINQKRTVDYVLLNDTSYTKDNIYVSVDETERYYTENKHEFRIPEKIKAEYIFISFDAFKKQHTANNNEARTFYDRNKEVFTDQKTNKILPFNKVKNEIAMRLLEQKAVDSAFEKATDISITLLRNPDLTNAALEHDAEIEETEYFTLNQELPGVPSSRDFITTAFETPVKKMSNALRTKEGFYIIMPMEKKASYIPKLEDVKEKVAEKLQNKKNTELLSKNAQSIRDQLDDKVKKEKLPFTDAAKSLGLNVSKSTPFKLNEEVKELTASIKENAFKTYKNTVGTPVRTKDGYVVVYVDTVETPQLSTLEDQRKTVKDELLNIKRDKVLSQWYRSLYKKAKVVDLTKKRKIPINNS
ncbi:MAG: SurA N-terminal domain-containing protein [Candidatus Ancaeobacter aquaticus]|nr:SurA N-terminal domain-containing protein [Candidatus Ancaeobacter aquaticus]